LLTCLAQGFLRAIGFESGAAVQQPGCDSGHFSGMPGGCRLFRHGGWRFCLDGIRA
jgi:hypothetical protein